MKRVFLSLLFIQAISLSPSAVAATVVVTPGAPVTLSPGGTLSITLKEIGSANGIPGQPVLTIGNENLLLLEKVSLGVEGGQIEVTPPTRQDCELEVDFHGDVGFERVKSCRLEVTQLAAPAPSLPLENLRGRFEFSLYAPIFFQNIDGIATSEFQSARGAAGTFAGVRILNQQQYTLASDNTTYLESTVELVTSFGVRQVHLDSREGSVSLPVGPIIVTLNSELKNSREVVTLDVGATAPGHAEVLVLHYAN